MAHIYVRPSWVILGNNSIYMVAWDDDQENRKTKWVRRIIHIKANKTKSGSSGLLSIL